MSMERPRSQEGAQFRDPFYVFVADSIAAPRQ